MSPSAKDFVDFAISQAAKEYQAIIVVSPVNKASYNFLFQGMAAKIKEVTDRTCDYGPFQGFILTEQGNDLIIDNKYAIRRNNQELWVDQPLKSDKKIKALVNEAGQYITADVDILLIASSAKYSEELIFNQYYGYLTHYELQIIEFINQTYSKSINKKNNIITHGPYNRYNKSLKELLKFPLEVFLPDVIYIDSLNNLRKLLLKQKCNFYLPVHWI
jgi:hypothetical protein